MLTAPELLTLIKAHNVLSKIKVPAKARKDAGALEKIINEANFKVDHVKKLIQPIKIKRGKSIKLSEAEELTKPKTDPAVNKAKREAKKVAKEADKQKELKLAKKEAVKEFKTKQNEGKKKGLKNKNLNISIEKMKGEEKQLVDFYGKSDKTYKNPPATNQPVKKAPVKKAPVKKAPVKKDNPFSPSNLKAKELVKLIDSLGLDYRFNRGRMDKGVYRQFLERVVSGGDFDTSKLKPVITSEERDKLPKHIALLYSSANKDNMSKLLNETSKKELVSKINSFLKTLK